MKSLTENDLLDFRSYIAGMIAGHKLDPNGPITISPECDAIELLAIVDLALKAERCRQSAITGWESARLLAIAGLHQATERAANAELLNLYSPTIHIPNTEPK